MEDVGGHIIHGWIKLVENLQLPMGKIEINDLFEKAKYLYNQVPTKRAVGTREWEDYVKLFHGSPVVGPNFFVSLIVKAQINHPEIQSILRKGLNFDGSFHYDFGGGYSDKKLAEPYKEKTS